MFAPNDDAPRRPLTPSSHIVKNKDRALLETTYQGDYSKTGGLGSRVVYNTAATVSPTEQLVSLSLMDEARCSVSFEQKPYFEKTLDPARPIEGTQALQIHGNQRPLSALKRQRGSRCYSSFETTR